MKVSRFKKPGIDSSRTNTHGMFASNATSFPGSMLRILTQSPTLFTSEFPKEATCVG